MENKRALTRRQAIKLGGIAAVGLIFAKPAIETIIPKPAFADYHVREENPGEGETKAEPQPNGAQIESETENRTEGHAWGRDLDGPPGRSSFWHELRQDWRNWVRRQR